MRFSGRIGANSCNFTGTSMHTPLYKSVEEHIRQQIEAGELRAGDLLPSEPQLAKQLDVSQGTVKKALDNLVAEKLLYRHQGKGTYVSRIDFNNSLFRFFSYGDQRGDDTRIHKETAIRRISRGPADICKRLGLATGSRLIYLERTGFVDDGPVLLEKSWWDGTLLAGLEDETVHIPDLLYAVIVDQFGVPVIRAEETLTAESADNDTATALSIETGAAVVVLHRLTYTSNNRPIEFRVTRGRADRFSYRSEIR